MKKLLVFCILICLFTGCSKEAEPVVNDIVSTENELSKQDISLYDSITVDTKSNESDNLFPMTETFDTNINPLASIVNKSANQYTLDDCYLLLNSPMDDICKTFGIDRLSQPGSGLLLPGSSYVSTVIFINHMVCLVSPTEDRKTKTDEMPERIYIFGKDGAKTLLDEFEYGMVLEQDLYDIADDSFYKYGPERYDYNTTKEIELKKENMIIALTFVYDFQRGGEYYLKVVCVSTMPENHELIPEAWQHAYAELLRSVDTYDYAVRDYFVDGSHGIPPIFYLHDIDVNGIPELIFISDDGNWENASCEVFSYTEDRVVKLGSIKWDFFGTIGWFDNNLPGLISNDSYKGHYGEIYYYTIQNGILDEQLMCKYDFRTGADENDYIYLYDDNGEIQRVLEDNENYAEIRETDMYLHVLKKAANNSDIALRMIKSFRFYQITDENINDIVINFDQSKLKYWAWNE